MDHTRFAFGENWKSYAALVDEEHVGEAVRRLDALVGADAIRGRSFLDIGCGSGLHSLAALRLGAARVEAIDLDEQSVDTSRRLLERFWGESGYRVRRLSVFELDPATDGRFDVVYSWGVLHHTGDMHRAIALAGRMVAPGGLLALGLYGKTRYCGAWTRIKRWYASADREQQERAQRIYIRSFGAYLLLRGKRLSRHIEQYHRKRGMEFRHDVHDWLGGYPYESIRPGELHALLERAGFARVKQIVKRRSGLFGSGCDEYVYRKR